VLFQPQYHTTQHTPHNLEMETTSHFGYVYLGEGQRGSERVREGQRGLERVREGQMNLGFSDKPANAAIAPATSRRGRESQWSLRYTWYRVRRKVICAHDCEYVLTHVTNGSHSHTNVVMSFYDSQADLQHVGDHGSPLIEAA
jgi:hypothetical protein